MVLNIRAQTISFVKPTNNQTFVLLNSQNNYDVNVMIYQQQSSTDGSIYSYDKLITNGYGDFDSKGSDVIPQWFTLPAGTYSFRAELWEGFIDGQEYMKASQTIAFYIVNSPPPLSVSISGPTSITYGQNGTWTAYASGGNSPYSYQWYYEYPNTNSLIANRIKPNLPPRNTWYTLGSNSSTLTTSFVQQANIKCIVTDAVGSAVTSNIISISVSNSSSSSKQSVSLTAGQLTEASTSANKDAKQITQIEIPEIYSLDQNYPNPFNPSTIIKYQIPKDGFVTLRIFDELGNEVKTLENGFRAAGSYSVNFNASYLPSGVYFYQLRSGNFVSTQKMILTK